MFKIDYSGLGAAPDFKRFQKELDYIARSQAPAFETMKTDAKILVKALAKFKKYKHVILIANGGSRTSARAFYHGLSEFRNNVVFKFLTSPEPRVIADYRKRYPKKNTLVLVISKSGDNINNIEPLLLMLDYPVLVVTGAQTSPLRSMAKMMKWSIIEHPEVEGRFSGLTSCGLVPALLMGLDGKKLLVGAEVGYGKYNSKIPLEKNDALKLAYYFLELGNRGFAEIFASIYSSSLVALLPLIVQLIHETYGKNGRGQTIFGDYSPESQHHTNQRLFGGPRNIIALFLGEEQTVKDLKIKVPTKLKKIVFRGHELGKLDGISAAAAMSFDRAGVVKHCQEKKVPAVELLADKITLETFAELLVFWQYFAVYSAILRHLNPFDQPEVEAAKKISLELRIKKH